MSNKWLCLTVGISFHHGNKNAAADKVKDIFGKDLKKALFVHNEVMWRTGEYFCFVLCSNYHSHINSLKKNSAFFRVIPSIEKPGWLTLDEVKKFTLSMRSEGTRKNLRRGDIILVKNGHLKNLYGLIAEKEGKKKYSVAFRFCLKKIIMTLSENSLCFVDSVFGCKKFPVTRKIAKGKPLTRFFCPEMRKAWLELANSNKLYRKTNRKRATAKRK
jgi:hypothetical protein